MNYKILISVIIPMFTTGCSMFGKLIFHPAINQGNYLNTDDITKIHPGMTKKEVTHILGTSILKNPFNSNMSYYVFRNDQKNALITQQTLVLIFNNNDILVHIDNKSIFITQTKNK